MVNSFRNILKPQCQALVSAAKIQKKLQTGAPVGRSGGGWHRDEGGGSTPPSPWAPTETPPQCPARGAPWPPAHLRETWRIIFNAPSLKPPKGFRFPGGPHLRSPTPPSLWQILPKHSPAPTPLPSPPIFGYLFGFTLLCFSACPRRQPVQGLFVNKLSRNVPFWGKIVSFAHRLLGPARWQEMGDTSAPGGLAGMSGARGGLSAVEEQEATKKELWRVSEPGWQHCHRGGMAESPGASAGMRGRAFVQTFPLPSWVKRKRCWFAAHPERLCGK